MEHEKGDRCTLLCLQIVGGYRICGYLTFLLSVYFYYPSEIGLAEVQFPDQCHVEFYGSRSDIRTCLVCKTESTAGRSLSDRFESHIVFRYFPDVLHFTQASFFVLGKKRDLELSVSEDFFKRLNIPVHRNDRVKAAKAFIQAKKAIESGWSLVIFPEGGIPDNKRPQMIPFKEGAFKLAKSTGIPIVPLTFLDNYHLFSDPDDLDFAHPGISRVCIHPYISVEDVKNLTEKELELRCFETIAGPLRERGLME